jgi:hypothetical protein
MKIGNGPLMSFKNGLASRVWALNGKFPDPRFTNSPVMGMSFRLKYEFIC